MTLGFKKTFPWGEPTYFKEKILAGAGYGPIVSAPKIHTIREGNRWKPGMTIHMAYGVRTKKYEQFNKGIDGLQRVVSVQKIEIEIYGGGKIVRIIIDDKIISDNPELTYQLAVNDGFDNLFDFFKWFSKDFVGQIIHWTKFRY
jgi:hypothetical protein